MCCDLRIATERSTFGIPAAKLGLAVDQWTIDRMTREFGWGIARAMLVGAEVFDADRLHRSGSVHRIGDVGDAIEWARVLATQAPLTVVAHKAALDESAQLQMHLRAVKIFASVHGHRATPKKGDLPLWRSDLRAFSLSSCRHYRFGGTRLFTLT